PHNDDAVPTNCQRLHQTLDAFLHAIRLTPGHTSRIGCQGLTMKNGCAFVAVLLAGVTLSNICAAEPARDPELLAHDYGRGADAIKPTALAIRALDIDVKITGDVARTSITATFSNPGPRVLEGDFVYDLPVG